MQEENLRTLTGVVLKKSTGKTIRVVVGRTVKHPKYNKYLRRKTKLAVHDEHNNAGAGDIVEIAECRPYSKNKRWRLLKILGKAVETQEA
jgi:small subunit ribosomal protein S17